MFGQTLYMLWQHWACDVLASPKDVMIGSTLTRRTAMVETTMARLALNL